MYTPERISVLTKRVKLLRVYDHQLFLCSIYGTLLLDCFTLLIHLPLSHTMLFNNSNSKLYFCSQLNIKSKQHGKSIKLL